MAPAGQDDDDRDAADVRVEVLGGKRGEHVRSGVRDPLLHLLRVGNQLQGLHGGQNRRQL